MMPTQEFKNAALRYTRLAEQATTASVRTHLLMLARHYEALIAFSPIADDVPGLPWRSGSSTLSSESGAGLRP